MVPKTDTSSQANPTSDKDKAKPTKEDKGKPSKEDKGKKEKTSSRTHTFLSETLIMARHLKADRILFVTDTPIGLQSAKLTGLKKKIIVASSSEKIGVQCEELGLGFELMPGYAFDRFEKVKVALASCVSSGALQQGSKVLCITGAAHSPDMDTCMLTRIGEASEESIALGVLHAGRTFSPQVLESILDLAIKVGFEGHEGSPVGTIITAGDATGVMEKSLQLTLNPFQGYSEVEKNILDPKVRTAIKNFSLLDGAVVIREDGVVLAAGRYLRAPDDIKLDLPMGFGTRHAAALAMTHVSKTLAFVVSKTTGTVRIYKDGKLAVEFKQPRRRM